MSEDLEVPKVPASAKREPEINKLFRAVMTHEASDLHLKAGMPGMMRLRGSIQKMNMPPITQENMEKLVYPILKPDQRETLDKTGGSDFAYVIGNDECRFRVNLFKQRGNLAMVARRVNTSVPSFWMSYFWIRFCRPVEP